MATPTKRLVDHRQNKVSFTDLKTFLTLKEKTGHYAYHSETAGMLTGGICTCRRVIRRVNWSL